MVCLEKFFGLREEGRNNFVIRWFHITIITAALRTVSIYCGVLVNVEFYVTS